MSLGKRLAVTAALAVVVVGPSMMAQGAGPPLERARALMRQVPLIDGHNDLPWSLRMLARYDLDQVDLREPQPKLHTDLARLRQGQVGAQFWSVFVPSRLDGKGAVTATLEQIDAVHEIVRRYPDTFALASTADEIERIFRRGRIASLIGMEGGHSIDSSLATLRMLHRLGARYMTLTHSANVAWADSGTDKPVLGGLSAFGEAVVREMNRLGMLVDLSHVSPDTMADAMRVTDAPVIFSHSSARALCDVPRNVPDQVLQALPANGGVVMVTFVPSFVSQAVADDERRLEKEQERWKDLYHDDESQQRAALAKWRADHPAPHATLAQVADHIDHVRKVAGIDYVGVGSDFDGIDHGPDGLEDVAKFPDLVAELVRRGYSDEDVKKVLGGNLLRVMRAAEVVAARLQKSRPPSVATIEQLDGRKTP